MRLGKFTKAVADRRRYVVDYDNWLAADELLLTVMVTGDVIADNFYIDGYIVDTGSRSVIFYISGGVADGEYDATVLITTSQDQIKEDWITLKVT